MGAAPLRPRADGLHVLVLDSGGLSTLPVMRSLKLAGARVTLAAGRTASCPAAASRYCDAMVRHPPLDHTRATLAFFAESVAARAVDVVLPILDSALLAVQPYRRELEAIVPLALAPAACVATALDKSATVAAARGLVGGLRVPATIAPSSAEEAAAWTGRYPVVVKPRVGSGSEGIRVARDADELRHAFALVDRDYPRPLVQERIEYRPGDKFVLLYLFDHRGELRTWYGQRVLRERRSLRVGTGDEPSRGGVALLWQSHRDDDLLARGRAMLEAMSWRGLAALEGARDRRDGQGCLFEINARLDGTSSLALRQGANLAHDACLVALGRPPMRRLDFAVGRRARKNLFVMLDARELRPALALLDPRWRPPLPLLLDPLPALREAGRLLRKRLPGGARATSTRTDGPKE